MKKFNLENEPKITSGFTIPDGYFDTFSEKILAQLPKQESKVVSIFSYRKTWYYAAAAILILMLSSSIYTKYSTQKEEIDSATLENYIAYQSNISEEEIVNLLQQEDLDKMKLEFNIDDAAIEDALKTNSNLEQYIID
jgi:predicted transport protein